MRIRAAASPRGGFDAYLEAFRDELRAHHFSASYDRLARSYLPAFFAYLRRRRIHDVRRVDEQSVIHFLRTEGDARSWSLSTKSVVCRTLKRFFAFLERRGLILQNPMEQLRMPRVVSLPRDVITQASARRLLAVPSPWTVLGQRDRALLELLYGTGLRASECVRTDVGDLDPARHTLLVRNGKGKKDRTVPVVGRAAAALRRYLEESRPELVRDPREPALFLSSFGKRLAKITLGHIIRAYGRAMGLRVYPHALRHACATHLLQGGADVRQIQQLLGHKHIDTTMIYTRVAIKDLQEAVGRAHPRGKKRSSARKTR